MRTVNIKEDNPTVDVALRRLNMVLTLAKSQGERAVKIIHGYGSGGQGGAIRTGARKFLAQQKAQGRIRAFIPGEEFSIFHPATLEAFALCPALRQDSDLGRSNDGVTVVLLDVRH